MTDEPEPIVEAVVDDEGADAAANVGGRVSRRESRAAEADTREGVVYLIGRIRADEVRRGASRVWLGLRECVDLNLTIEQRERVAAALHDRDATLVRVRGKGRYRVTGELLHAHEVEQVDLLDPDISTPDPDAPTLSEMIERAFADVPDEVWAALPRDMAERHDDYFAAIGDGA